MVWDSGSGGFNETLLVEPLRTSLTEIDPGRRRSVLTRPAVSSMLFAESEFGVS